MNVKLIIKRRYSKHVCKSVHVYLRFRMKIICNRKMKRKNSKNLMQSLKFNSKEAKTLVDCLNRYLLQNRQWVAVKRDTKSGADCRGNFVEYLIRSRFFHSTKLDHWNKSAVFLQTSMHQLVSLGFRPTQNEASLSNNVRIS